MSLEAVASAFGGGIAGTAAVLTLLWKVGHGALVNVLIRDDLNPVYAHRSAVDRLTDRVQNAEDHFQALERLYLQVRERGDANDNMIARLQEADQHRWAPVARALERIGDRMDEMDRRLARIEALSEGRDKGRN